MRAHCMACTHPVSPCMHQIVQCWMETTRLTYIVAFTSVTTFSPISDLQSTITLDCLGILGSNFHRLFLTSSRFRKTSVLCETHEFGFSIEVPTLIVAIHQRLLQMYVLHVDTK